MFNQKYDGKDIFVCLCNTYTCCRALSNGTVTTWLYDIGLSQLGFEQPTFRISDSSTAAMQLYILKRTGNIYCNFSSMTQLLVCS